MRASCATWRVGMSGRRGVSCRSAAAGGPGQKRREGGGARSPGPPRGRTDRRRGDGPVPHDALGRRPGRIGDVLESNVALRFVGGQREFDAATEERLVEWDRGAGRTGVSQ